MAEVAYLLGAGASAGCIPVVNGMRDDTLNLLQDIRKVYDRATISEEIKIGVFKECLDKLYKICDEHSSIDTYAKKLFLSDLSEFNKLKIDLCFYFTIRQEISTSDKRYDNFFASILNSVRKLPEKINIISWNYDYQLEASFRRFAPSYTMDDCRKQLSLVTPADWNKLTHTSNGFNVLKLNGSARISEQKTKYYLLNEDVQDLRARIKFLIELYFEMYQNSQKVKYTCELKFAWEKADQNDFINAAKPILSRIETLVIIGYSFPFFNRDVDMELFEQMFNLDKIIIQDKNPDNIREVLLEIIPDVLLSRIKNKIFLKSNVDQFVFPKELEIN